MHLIQYKKNGNRYRKIENVTFIYHAFTKFLANFIRIALKIREE